MEDPISGQEEAQREMVRGQSEDDEEQTEEYSNSNNWACMCRPWARACRTSLWPYHSSQTQTSGDKARLSEIDCWLV